LVGPLLFGCPALFLPGGWFPIGGTDTDTGSGTDAGTGINGGEPAGEPLPELGEVVSVQVINQSGVEAGVRVRFLVGDLQVRETVLVVPAGATMDTIGPDRATLVEAQGQYSTGDSTPNVAWRVGEDFEDSDLLQYILRGPGEPVDGCPDDPDKTEPGVCGCGVPDTDSDSDGAADCVDGCPQDPNKTEEGRCGCGKPEDDGDSDGTPDCVDQCPADPNKTEPGACGCGKPDTDANSNGVADCKEGGAPQPADRDQDGVPDSQDNCPSIPNPEQGDYDEDGVGDVCDNCSGTPNSGQEDTDEDGWGDACDCCPYDPKNDEDYDYYCANEDNCPSVYNPDQYDLDEDGLGDACDPCPADPQNDGDQDGACECVDNCPSVSNPDQADGDGDGVGDACDACPNTIPGVTVDETGCPIPAIRADFDQDGDVDLDDFAILQACFSGHDHPQTDPACAQTLLDGDDDVDGVDVDLFDRCYSGSNVPADPACRDCNGNSVDDREDLIDCPPSDSDCDDCNSNGLPDSCDIAERTDGDVNGNRIPDECEPQACCLATEYGCEDLLPGMCLMRGGTRMGVDTTCETVTCYPPMLEACCVGTECMYVDVATCYSYEGQPQGPGSYCDPYICSLP